jgi:hypothetical protein
MARDVESGIEAKPWRSSGDRYRGPKTMTAEIKTLKARYGFLAVAGRSTT